MTLEVLGGHHPEEMCKYLKGDFLFNESTEAAKQGEEVGIVFEIT